MLQSRAGPGSARLTTGALRAGGTADALTLFERLEQRLEEFPGQLTRAATTLARDWRTDRYLRKLEATMVVTDGENAYLISGGGDVMNAESISSVSDTSRVAATASRRRRRFSAG